VSLSLQAHHLQVESLAVLETLLGSFRLDPVTHVKPPPAAARQGSMRQGREGRGQAAEAETREPGCNVVVHIEKGGAGGGVKGSLTLGSNWRVQPDDELLSSLRERFGNASVTLNYQ